MPRGRRRPLVEMCVNVNPRELDCDTRSSSDTRISIHFHRRAHGPSLRINASTLQLETLALAIVDVRVAIVRSLAAACLVSNLSSGAVSGGGRRAHLVGSPPREQRLSQLPEGARGAQPRRAADSACGGRCRAFRACQGWRAAVGRTSRAAAQRWAERRRLRTRAPRRAGPAARLGLSRASGGKATSGGRWCVAVRAAQASSARAPSTSARRRAARAREADPSQSRGLFTWVTHRGFSCRMLFEGLSYEEPPPAAPEGCRMTADARSVRLEMPVGETRAKHVHVDLADVRRSASSSQAARGCTGSSTARIDPNESEWDARDEERRAYTRDHARKAHPQPAACCSGPGCSPTSDRASMWCLCACARACGSVPWLGSSLASCCFTPDCVPKCTRPHCPLRLRTHPDFPPASRRATRRTRHSEPVGVAQLLRRARAVATTTAVAANMAASVPREGPTRRPLERQPVLSSERLAWVKHGGAGPNVCVVNVAHGGRIGRAAVGRP